MFKTRFDTFGNDFDQFSNFAIFLKTFRRLDPPWNTGQKTFSKKLPQNMFKTRLDTFRNDFDRFWNFANFSKTFRRLDPPWNTGQKNFQKNYPKICSKHVWTNWERFWASFKFWKFFKNISKTGPSLEHWAKKLFEKYPKTRSKYFWTIWERFWAILEFWKFFDFLKTFRILDPPWSIGQKEISEKSTPKLVQNTFGQFGNDFRRFCNFEFF